MIIINPSDIINNPNLELINQNAYGKVHTTLHNVYQSQDDKADISLSFNSI